MADEVAEGTGFEDEVEKALDEAPADEANPSEQAPPEATPAELKFGDKAYKFEDVKARVEWYEQNEKWKAKNTQEAMRLADERRSLQKARQLEEWLNANPDKYKAVEAVFKQNQAQTPPGQQAQFPELGEVRKVAEEMKTQLAYNNIKEEMVELKEKYADDFKADPDLSNKIFRHAIENQMEGLPLRVIFKDMMSDSWREKSFKQGMEKAQTAKKTSQALGSPAGSKGGAVKPSGPMDDNKLFESIMNDDSWGDGQ